MATDNSSPAAGVGATVSFELFPPKTPEGKEKLAGVCAELAKAGPEFFSVTFGAGGSTQEGTLQTVLDIRSMGQQAAPHLSCVGASRDGIRALIAQYRAHGIRRIVTLRGDLPSGMGQYGEFSHARQLIEFIRAETGDWFHIEVAAYPEVHPQARSPQDDLKHFAEKVKVGADSAITQYFFNADAYFRFVDEARKLGVDAPIVPGIMPITNSTQLLRFSDACGAEVPRWIRMRLQSLGDDANAIKAFGLDVVADLCRRLLDGGAPGVHFYTLNQSVATLSLLKRI
ncbi:MAG: methylenetetrahydrofolate reductase [NAD(P)H] [Candidatus Protistobacter heckmanni]|nr:methylenetetrahydrofolate reductase [NAD(P)H] [Candidatus Protistobacter heckmanni]MCS6764886.1 methylenetetrahydrofolate reductase [NAD(P)H] [Candidatus Protistobacter heckmanni]